MKDFIKLALTKNPKKRPSAEKLLQVSVDLSKDYMSIITKTVTVLDTYNISKIFNVWEKIL